MMAKQWIAYGLAGVVGVSVLAGAATLAAQALEMRTDDGRMIDRGGIEAGLVGGVTPGTPTESTDPSVAVRGQTGAPSVVSVASVTEPEQPAAPAPQNPAPVAPVVSVVSPVSPVEVSQASPASVTSVDSVD